MADPGRGEAIEWRSDLDAPAWDRALAALGGHPLQSAFWGDARKEVDGIEDYRWMALRGGTPVWMMRTERRPLPAFGWVGWAPRGPTGDLGGSKDLPPDLKRRLPAGMKVLVTDRWEPRAAGGPAGPHTIWIDLSAGLEVLSRNLDKQWRYGVGRARRLGVTVDFGAGAADLTAFYALCEAVGERKRVRLINSLPLLARLLSGSGAHVEAKLLLARYQGRIGAGAFIIRCGRSLHYFWGATDREASGSRAGEAVQWAAIEWGVAQGCTRYDLEGITPARNSGTYAFKKKMGGEEVALAGKAYHAVGLIGRALAPLVARRS